MRLWEKANARLVARLEDEGWFRGIKSVLITGASSGIGREYFRALSDAAHMEITTVDVRPFRNDCGRHIRLDLSLPDATERLEELLEQLAARGRAVDLLILAAGSGQFRRFKRLGLSGINGFTQLNCGH